MYSKRIMFAKCLKTFPHRAALTFEILPNVGMSPCQQQGLSDSVFAPLGK